MTLSPDEIQTLVRGDHGDPVGVLGPHRVSLDGTPAVAVRAFPRPP